MLAKARELLEPKPDETLLNLYCGYGLFSHFLAPSYKQVLEIDGECPAIRSAIFNKSSIPLQRRPTFWPFRLQ